MINQKDTATALLVKHASNEVTVRYVPDESSNTKELTWLDAKIYRSLEEAIKAISQDGDTGQRHAVMVHTNNGDIKINDVELRALISYLNKNSEV